VWLTAIFPQVSFTLGISKIVFTNKNLPTPDCFSSGNAIGMLVISGIIYLLLALYLEQVLPNSQGTNRHPLFFLSWIKKQKQEHPDSLSIPLSMENEMISEECSANFYQTRQEHDEPSIKLKAVSKNFGDKAVVNNVSMSFYLN
jgi:hypothetical protein